VSCDFEVGTNVSCEESTGSPRAGLIFRSTPPSRPNKAGLKFRPYLHPSVHKKFLWFQ